MKQHLLVKPLKQRMVVQCIKNTLLSRKKKSQQERYNETFRFKEGNIPGVKSKPKTNRILLGIIS